MKIVKFSASSTGINNRKLTHKAKITVEHEGVSKEVQIPVFAGSSSMAITKARAWRKKQENMRRIEDAFTKNLSRVEQRNNG